MHGMQKPETRYDWSLEEARTIFNQPFNDLLFEAQTVHRQHFDANEVQVSTLLSIKTGGCPEDCSYCSQSSHFETGVEATKLMDVDEVLEGARRAKEGGATRYCMGAAWRSPKDRDMDAICDMVSQVRDMGMETCMTLGMLSESQAQRLSEAGLDYYNHNIDTSRDYYDKIITTRTFDDRLDTLEHVRSAGMKVCCGGILGMGEQDQDRVSMLVTLANLDQHPESVPINMLMKIDGTPLAKEDDADALSFIRTIALARILMPKSMVRLSAGREHMSDELQALAFMAGANSIFVGEKLLTTKNPDKEKDSQLFNRLGLSPMPLTSTPS